MTPTRRPSTPRAELGGVVGHGTAGGEDGRSRRARRLRRASRRSRARCASSGRRCPATRRAARCRGGTRCHCWPSRPPRRRRTRGCGWSRRCPRRWWRWRGRRRPAMPEPLLEPPGGTIKVPRVAGEAVGVGQGAAHGELVEVELAEQHRARGVQTLDDGGVLVRHEVCQDAGACGGADALGVQLVLQRDGYAVPWGRGTRRARWRRRPLAPSAARGRPSR